MRRLKNKRIYLATVYSSNPDGIDEAFKQASRLTGRMLKAGYTAVYNPITHTHPIAIYGEINPYNHSIWLPFDEHMMDWADCIVVAKMPNYKISKEIAHKIQFFKNQNKKIYFMDIETLEINLSV